MRFEERAPTPALRDYIACYWMIDAPQPGTVRDRTFPDGCQEIVLHIDSVVRRSDNRGLDYFTLPAAELVGQMTRPYDIITDGRQRYFGVKFFPHTFSVFTRECVHDLRDQSIALRDLMPGSFSEVIEGVAAQPTFETFVASCDRYFQTQTAWQKRPDRSYQVVDLAVRRLLSGTRRASVATLHEDVGVSRRGLQNAFKRHVGLMPKQLARMWRFQTTFRLLHDARRPLTDVALECGYYDHAHFTREFTELSGQAPSIYRQSDAPLNRFFLDASSRAYLCNVRG